MLFDLGLQIYMHNYFATRVLPGSAQINPVE